MHGGRRRFAAPARSPLPAAIQAWSLLVCFRHPILYRRLAKDTTAAFPSAAFARDVPTSPPRRRRAPSPLPSSASPKHDSSACPPAPDLPPHGHTTTQHAPALSCCFCQAPRQPSPTHSREGTASPTCFFVAYVSHFSSVRACPNGACFLSLLNQDQCLRRKCGHDEGEKVSLNATNSTNASHLASQVMIACRFQVKGVRRHRPQPPHQSEAQAEKRQMVGEISPESSYSAGCCNDSVITALLRISAGAASRLIGRPAGGGSAPHRPAPRTAGDHTFSVPPLLCRRSAIGHIRSDFLENERECCGGAERQEYGLSCTVAAGGGNAEGVEGRVEARHGARGGRW